MRRSKKRGRKKEKEEGEGGGSRARKKERRRFRRPHLAVGLGGAGLLLPSLFFTLRTRIRRTLFYFSGEKKYVKQENIAVSLAFVFRCGQIFQGHSWKSATS